LAQVDQGFKDTSQIGPRQQQSPCVNFAMACMFQPRPKEYIIVTDVAEAGYWKHMHDLLWQYVMTPYIYNGMHNYQATKLDLSPTSPDNQAGQQTGADDLVPEVVKIQTKSEGKQSDVQMTRVPSQPGQNKQNKSFNLTGPRYGFEQLADDGDDNYDDSEHHQTEPSFRRDDLPFKAATKRTPKPKVNRRTLIQDSAAPNSRQKYHSEHCETVSTRTDVVKNHSSTSPHERVGQSQLCDWCAADLLTSKRPTELLLMCNGC
jgi:hypothetical protein